MASISGFSVSWSIRAMLARISFSVSFSPMATSWSRACA